MEAQVEADLQAASELVKESDPSDSDVGSAVLSSPPLASSRRKPGPKPGMKRGRARRTSGRGNSEKVLGEEEDEVEQRGGKRGRLEEEQEEDANATPSKVTRRGRKPRQRATSPPTPTLPPKKFFKNREENNTSLPEPVEGNPSPDLPRKVSSSALSAGQPEADSVPPASLKGTSSNVDSSPKNATTATPSSDTRDFKQWLETKLSPSPVPSVVARSGIENSLPRAPSAASRTLEPHFSKPQGTAQFTPVQPSSHLNTSPPPSPPHTNGVLSHAGDDGSSDEDFSPTLGNNRAADCSLSSTQDENEANKDCQSEKKRTDQ